MSTISGVKPANLKALEETLWEWTAIQERSARLWSWADAPWWYGERALLSTLAGAIWRSGGIALEEYGMEKRARGRGQKLRKGRNDLYFRLGSTNFVLEAKHSWASLRSATSISSIRGYLERACEDARAVPVDGSIRLAALTVSPGLPKQSSEGLEEIEAWVRAITKISGAASAWMFPIGCRRLYWPPEDSYFPGVVLFVQRV